MEPFFIILYLVKIKELLESQLVGKKNKSFSKLAHIEDVEDVAILSSDENGESNDQPQAYAHENVSNIGAKQIIVSIEDTKVEFDEDSKVKHVSSLEAQLQKELMQLGTKRGQQVFNFNNESQNAERVGKCSGFKKLFFKK
jgi:hypothetical protein